MRLYAFCVCSPTRASLRTCRLPAHVNQMNDRSISQPLRTPSLVAHGMDMRMRTLPQLLGEAGYSVRPTLANGTSARRRWRSSLRAGDLTRALPSSCAAPCTRRHLLLAHLINPSNGMRRPRRRFSYWENESRRRHQDAAHTNPEGSDVCHGDAASAREEPSPNNPT